MRRIISFICALSMIAAVTSCSSGNNSQKERTLTAQQLTDKAYKLSRGELPEELMAIYSMQLCSEGKNLFIVGSAADATPAFYTADTEFTNFQRLEIPEFSVGVNYSVAMADNGEIIALVNEADIDEEEGTASEYRFVINRFSADGKLISSNEIADIYDTASPENASLSKIYCCGENCVAWINGSWYAIGLDGSFKGELKTASAEQQIIELGMDNQGNIHCAIDCGEDMLKVCKVDAAKAEIEESSVKYNFSDGITGGLLPGTGDYTLYIPARGSIYGITSDGSIESVFDVSAAGVNPNILGDAYISSSGELWLPETDMSAFTVKLKKYTECDPSELENIPVIKIGINLSVNGTNIAELAEELNESQSEYRVEVIDYNAEYWTEEKREAPMEQMAMELISGEAPDIMLTDKLAYMNLDEKGAFADLYQFMENDEELNRKSFNENILSLAEDDGKLYELPNSVALETIVGKTKYFEGLENWNIQECIAAFEQYGDKLGSLNNNNESRMYREDFMRCVNGVSFIDIENSTCSFVDSGYAKALEYAEDLPSIYDVIDTDFPELSEEVQNALMKERNLAYRNDSNLISTETIRGYIGFHDIKEGKYGEDITLLGYASDNGEGTQLIFDDCFAISENSPNKELAWEVLKSFFTDEWYDESFASIPVTKSGLAQMREQAKTPVEYEGTDYTGDYYYIGGDEKIEIGLISDVDIEFLNEVISSTKSVTNSIPEALYEILNEEQARFFAGECTADECAEALQSRIELYLAEKQ